MRISALLRRRVPAVARVVAGGQRFVPRAAYRGRRRYTCGCVGGEEPLMRAVTLPEPSAHAPAHDVLVPRTDIVVPEPGPGQVRVRVHATGVCHRDVLDRKGAFPFINRPTILGHEIAGVIESVGDGVDEARVGKRVVSLHWGPCGACRHCLRDDSTVCDERNKSFFALTADGGYADYVVNGDSAFVEVPAGWDAVSAAPVMCTHGTAWHAAVVKGKLQAGESVLVTGASGGVGSAAVQLFRALGAKVIAVTSSEDKREYLARIGADEVIVATSDEPAHKHAAVREIGGVDMAFDTVGDPTFATSLRALRPGGRLVLIGNVTNAVSKLPLGLMIINSLSVVGSDSITASELEDVFAMLTEHDIRPIVSHVLPLEEASVAHDILERKQAAGRIVLQLTDDGW